MLPSNYSPLWRKVKWCVVLCGTPLPHFTIFAKTFKSSTQACDLVHLPKLVTLASPLSNDPQARSVTTLFISLLIVPPLPCNWEAILVAVGVFAPSSPSFFYKALIGLLMASSDDVALQSRAPNTKVDKH
jgi:hypothetical protein